MKIGDTVPPYGGNGKHPGGIPIMRPHHKDGLNTDRTGIPVVICESTIYLWHESHKEFGAQFTVIISVTVNAVHRHRPGSVKSTSPVTESKQKWLRELYNIYTNFIMTSVENNNDTKYTNKNDTNNHNAHDLHK